MILDRVQNEIGAMFDGTNRGAVTMNDLDLMIKKSAKSVYARLFETSELLAANRSSTLFVERLYQTHGDLVNGEVRESAEQLLAEAGGGRVATDLVDVKASGVEAAADEGDVRSPETYVGYSRAENFVSPGGAVEDARHAYASGAPRLNEWSLSGDWTVGAENAVLDQAGGGITYRFHARDLHLVLGPSKEGDKIRFRITMDGKQ